MAYVHELKMKTTPFDKFIKKQKNWLSNGFGVFDSTLTEDICGDHIAFIDPKTNIEKASLNVIGLHHFQIGDRGVYEFFDDLAGCSNLIERMSYYIDTVHLMTDMVDRSLDESAPENVNNDMCWVNFIDDLVMPFDEKDTEFLVYRALKDLITNQYNPSIVVTDSANADVIQKAATKVRENCNIGKGIKTTSYCVEEGCDTVVVMSVDDTYQLYDEPVEPKCFASEESEED